MKSILIFFKSNWFALLLLFLGLHITFFQVFGYDLKNIAGDLGDSRFIIAITEYNYLWFTGHYDNYWDGFFFFPEKEAISYSDNLLGITPFYAIARFFGGGEMHTSFQILILICHVLNFSTCYWSLRKLSGTCYASAVGAFIFAFSISLNGIHTHLQFLFRFCIPLFFYFLHLYLNEKNRRHLVYVMFILLFQFYIGAYLGTFLLVIGGFFALCHLLISKVALAELKKIVLHCFVVVPSFIILMMPMVYFYYKRVRETGFYAKYDYISETIPRLSSYFKSFPDSLLWRSLEQTDVESSFSWMHYLFPGALVFICLLSGVYFALKKDRIFLILTATLVLLLCFTISFDGHSLYYFLTKVPGIKTVRVVTRIITVFIFPVAWIVCLNVAKWTNIKSKLRFAVIALLPFLVLADNYCYPTGFKTFAKEESKKRVSILVDQIQSDHRPTFAFIPGRKENAHLYHLDAMLAALTVKKKTINGYSSSCNRYYGPFWTNIDSVSVDFWCRHMNYPMDSVLLVK